MDTNLPNRISLEMLFNRKGLPCLSRKFGEELLLRRFRGPDTGGRLLGILIRARARARARARDGANRSELCGRGP